MKKYFYSDGKEKLGPLGLEELKEENIANDTLIWFEGLDDWTPASELEEMKPILELKPPSISTFNEEPKFEALGRIPLKNLLNESEISKLTGY